MRHLARTRALLLLLVFLGMGTVAPVVDAVAYHRSSSSERAHVESRDNPACHFERCAFPLVQATSAGAPAAPAAAATVVPTTGRTLLPPSLSTPRTARPGALRSRAPPSPLA